MAFGAALRAALARDPARFDRDQILAETVAPMVVAACGSITTLG